MRSSKNYSLILIAVLFAAGLSSCSRRALVGPPGPEPCDCQFEQGCSDEAVIRSRDVIKVYSDTHIFGGRRLVAGMEKAIAENIDHLYPALPSLRERTFYIGDIVDLKNAPKPEAARKLITEIRKAAGGNYIRGNHEMDAFGDAGENRFTIYEGKVLFLHGHTLRYFEPRANYWESGRRMVTTPEEMKRARSTDEVFMEAARLAAEKGCEVVVFGHTHPDSLIERNINGIRVINVRKGCTYLHIPLE